MPYGPTGNPLANDDQYLPSTRGVDMFGSPAGLDTGVNNADPLGMQGMPNNNELINQFSQQMQQIANRPLLQPAPPSTEAQMYYSPSTGNIVVNGFEFNQRNATQALASTELADQPARQFTLPDTATDWRPMPRQEYDSYINSIRNPSFGRSLSEGWENAWRGVGDIALGAGNAIAEATGNRWEWGQQARANILREYEENAPFMMQLRDIQDPGDALVWTSQMLVQGIPWLVETLASMAAGAAIGGAVSGGVGAPAGAVEGFIAKEGLRRGLTQALRRNLVNGARIYRSALAESGAAQLSRQQALRYAARQGGEEAVNDVTRFMNFGERAFHLSRGGRLGALASSGASNYLTGVGDIHNSIVDAGGDPTTAEAIANIWGMALPYAAIESLGDVVATQPITHLFPNITQGASRFGNALRHGGLTALAEGTEEGAQYVVTQGAVAGATNRPIEVDPYDLLENALGGAVGGFGVGAPLGALNRGRPRVAGLIEDSSGRVITPPPASTPPLGGDSGTTQVAEPQGAWEDLYDPSIIPGMGQQEDDVHYDPMRAVQDRLRNMPSAGTEQEYLRTTLLDPGLTEDQRNSIIQSLDALQGGRDVDYDAAQRGGEGVARAPNPQEPINIGEPDLSVPITDQELAGLQEDQFNRAVQQSQDPTNVDIPPNLATRGAAQGQRSPVAIYQDVAVGREVPREELIILRNAIADLGRINTEGARNPDTVDPRYGRMVQQLDEMINAPEPSANDYMQGINVDPNGYSANFYQEDTPVRAQALPPTTTSAVELGEDGLPKYGKHRLLKPSKSVEEAQRREQSGEAAKERDGLRGRTEEPAAEDLRDMAKRKAAEQKAKEQRKLKNKKRNERKKRPALRKRNADADRRYLDKMAQTPPSTEDQQREYDERVAKSPFRRDEQRDELYRIREATRQSLTDEDRARMRREAEEALTRRNKEEKSDAVQERSTKAETVRDEPRASKEDGSRDSARAEATRASADQTNESVQEPQVDQERIAKARTALLALAKKEGRDLKGARQKVAGVWSRVKRGASTKQSWATVDGKPLTAEEYIALIRQLDNELNEAPKPNKAEPTTAERAEKKAASFHEDVKEAWARNKDDPKAFSSFVLDNITETQQWINSKVAGTLPTARREAEKIISSVSKGTPQASGSRPTNPERTGPRIMNKAKVKSVVDKTQRRINKDYRFRTTHVFNNIDDLINNANEEFLIDNDGNEVTLSTFAVANVMREMGINRPIEANRMLNAAEIWLRDYMGGATALVIKDYKAMIVFGDMVANERELLEVLEHETIVHSGIRTFFDGDFEHSMFLHRLLSVPGVTDRIKELVHMYPVYGGYTRIQMAEEVIAFHAQEGPLALKQLMSAKEALNPETRKTLWEDFVSKVMEWIRKIFGDTRTDTEKVLDDIVEALRHRAITGANADLNAILDKNGVMSTEGIIKQMADRKIKLETANDNKPQLAAAIPTPEETQRILYGGEENPGRPYEPTPWLDEMKGVIRSNEPLIAKLKEGLNKAGSSTIKENLKALGRNIEPMSSMAMRSTLVEKTLRIMHDTIAVARRIMTKRQETRQYAIKSETTAPMRSLFGDKEKGSSKKELDAYNRMAIVATNSKLPTATEEIVRQAPRILVRHANGLYSINREVFEELLKKGTFTKQDFLDGIPQYTVTGDGEPTLVETAKLPKDVIDAGYEIYLSETRHMAESMLETLEHAVIMLNQLNDSTVERLVKESGFKEEDELFVNEMLERMYKLYSDIAFYKSRENGRKARHRQKEMARQVLAELMRAMHTKEKVEDWLDSSKKRPGPSENYNNARKNDAFKWREQTDIHDDVKPFAAQINWFLGNDSTTGKPRLERLNEVYTGKFGDKKQRQYAMLGAFQGLLNTHAQATEHENDVIQSVLGNYVEFTRKGKHRVYVDIKDVNGNKADVNPEMLAVLPVIYPKTEQEAKDLQLKLQEQLSGTYEMLNAEGETIEIKFDIGRERAPGTRTLAEAPSVKQFLEVADIAGLKLDASQMKQIANLIENAAGRKRFGLQRSGTPGMDADIIRNNNETMTRRAWWAAKTSQAWMLDDVFADQKNLYGDWNKLRQLQREFDIANRGAPEGEKPPANFVRNEAAVYLAETKLLRYANQLKYMSRHTLSRPTVDIRTTKGEKKLKIEPEAQAHLDHAVALRESLNRNELELNLNDLLSKTGPLRMFAVVSQLGSVAAGIMNAFTVVTHLPWVLTAQHGRTGYGEGHSFTDVSSEIISAMTQVFNPIKNWDDSTVVKELLDSAKEGNNTTSLTVPELEFLYQETLEGLLMPQQTYSMTGGTQSSISDLFWRNVSEGLLAPFGRVEAANRRVSALVAYRLAKQRYMKSGVAEAKLNDIKSDEYKALLEDVRRVVFNSQGDYANVNRPKAFRGDLAQYVLMYKMFPLITQIMLYNLPTKQQLAVLGVLFLLGGLKAEPFADDFMDIYDTLLQKLGFKHDSVELSLVQFFEDILPGSSSTIMYGNIDKFAFGGTLSTRVSMGDILPLTGALREGADFGRELENALGPAYSANAAAIEWAWTLTDFVIQQLGLKTQTTSAQELIRKFPQAQIRALGEAALMAQSGEITDPRGRLTSDEVDIFNIFTRALGFYPLEATRANTAVRLDRMHTGYMRAIRARFILAYANAYRANDQATMDRIRNSVREWNDSARETGQEDMLIRNFRSAAVRAGRAASSTTIERTASGAPSYSLIDDLAEIMNADTEAND